MHSLTSAVPWERVKAERALQGDGGCRGAAARGGCAMQCWCSQPHPASHQAGQCLGKVTPSSRAVDGVRWASRGPAGSCQLCRGKLWLQQWNCKESSAAGLRGLVSEREKRGLSHPCLTFV